MTTACMNGHLAEDDFANPPALRGQSKPFCPECGAKRIDGCLGCGRPIAMIPTGYINSYQLPDFCEGCGSWFPWTSREKRIASLYNLIDFEQDLDEGKRLEIVEQLSILTAPQSDQEDTVKKIEAGERVKVLAPKLWESGRQVLVDVVSAAAKQGLGL